MPQPFLGDEVALESRTPNASARSSGVGYEGGAPSHTVEG